MLLSSGGNLPASWFSPIRNSKMVCNDPISFGIAPFSCDGKTQRRARSRSELIIQQSLHYLQRLTERNDWRWYG